jgi:hypothetical protein
LENCGYGKWKILMEELVHSQPRIKIISSRLYLRENAYLFNMLSQFCLAQQYVVCHASSFSMTKFLPIVLGEVPLCSEIS